MTLALRHRARVLGQLAAAQAAEPAGKRAGAPASEYALQRARLGVDLRRLKEIQSIERKIELKRELIPGYVPWISGVLAANTGAQDDILVQVMIWMIDCGEFGGATALAEYVIRHDLALPERFERTAPTLICEEIADAALKSIGQGGTFDRAILDWIDSLVHDADIFDVVRAKLYKAQAILLAREAEAIDPGADGPAGARQAGVRRALDLYRRAYGLSHTVGVKKDIDRLERELKKLADPT